MILRLLKNKHLLSDPRVSLFVYGIWIIILVIALYILGIFNDQDFKLPTSFDGI